MLRMRFAKLDAWQDEHGVNDVVLGERTGLSHSTIGRAKRGQIRLTIKNMLAIQDVTGVSPDDWGDFYRSLPPRETAKSSNKQDVRA